MAPLNDSDHRAELQKLHHQLREFKEVFDELVDSVNEINKMVGVVRDISGKTDLLALNASIEAARAGQAGRGFAIVAHEVARLAEKSQESIQNVENASDQLEERIISLSQKIHKTMEAVSTLERKLNPLNVESDALGRSQKAA